MGPRSSWEAAISSGPAFAAILWDDRRCYSRMEGVITLSGDSQPEGTVEPQDHMTAREVTPRRRAVVRGAAWAAPTIVLGAAAPAEASSPPPLAATASWSCAPGGPKGSWRYRVTVTLTSGLACTTVVRIQSAQLRVGGHKILDHSMSMSVPGKGSTSQGINSDVTSSSGQGVMTLTYSYRDCAGITRAETRQIALNPLGECGGHGDQSAQKSGAASTPVPAPQQSIPATPSAPTSTSAPTSPVAPSPVAPSPAAPPAIPTQGITPVTPG